MCKLKLMADYKDKIVVITGGSDGIGKALVAQFLALGAKVATCGRTQSKLDDLAREFNSPNLLVITADVSQQSDCTSFIEKVVSQWGTIDILINNAGAIPSGDLWDVDQDSWRKGWDLKVYGYVGMCRAFYTKMKNAGGGVIINNIGNGGEVLDPKYIAGASGNASLMGFTRALGAFSLDDNIRVVGVNPGPVDTDRIYNMLKKRAIKDHGDESRARDLAKGYPLERPAHKHEVSDIIVFLSSYRSGYVSGTIVTVDGGIASRRSII